MSKDQAEAPSQISQRFFNHEQGERTVKMRLSYYSLVCDFPCGSHTASKAGPKTPFLISVLYCTVLYGSPLY